MITQLLRTLDSSTHCFCTRASKMITRKSDLRRLKSRYRHGYFGRPASGSIGFVLREPDCEKRRNWNVNGGLKLWKTLSR